MKPENVAIVVILFAVAGAIGAMTYLFWPMHTSTTAAPLAIELRPDDAAFVAMGEDIYEQYCASCHGANLEGQFNWQRRNADGRLPAPPHNAFGHTWHHPDEALFQLTKYGPAALIGQGYESDMPGYEGTLTDEEILAVLSYIKSQWPVQIRDQHDQINAGQGHH